MGGVTHYNNNIMYVVGDFFSICIWILGCFGCIQLSPSLSNERFVIVNVFGGWRRGERRPPVCVQNTHFNAFIMFLFSVKPIILHAIKH